MRPLCVLLCCSCDVTSQDSHEPTAINTQVDWMDTSDSYILKANLPGLTREDVTVEVEDGRILQISGEHKKEKIASLDRLHSCVEGVQGSFLCRFPLPANAKVEHVTAAMKNGLLTVIIPKAGPTESKTSIQTIKISD